jgi:hypothetical protein
MPLKLANLITALAIPAFIACGDVEDNSTSGDDDTDSPNPPPPAPGGVFVPENLEILLVDGRDVELKALTMQKDEYGLEILVAARNPGPDFLCDVEFVAALADDDDVPLAVPGIPVRGSMYDASGEVMNCLGPGEGGLGGNATYGFESVEFSRIVRLYIQFRGYLHTAATKLTTVSIEGLTTGSYSGGLTTVRGRVENHGTTNAMNPEVQVFSVNDVGRPLAQGIASGTSDVARDAAWDFEVEVPGPMYTRAATLIHGGF